MLLFILNKDNIYLSKVKHAEIMHRSVAHRTQLIFCALGTMTGIPSIECPVSMPVTPPMILKTSRPGHVITYSGKHVKWYVWGGCGGKDEESPRVSSPIVLLPSFRRNWELLRQVPQSEKKYFSVLLR